MKKKKTKLENGKFYLAYGGKAHPAQIYEKTEVGTYKSIKTGTTNGRDMIEIKPTQKGIEHSYIKNRPFEGVRSDYGDRELCGISFSTSDITIINEIKKRKSRRTKKAKLRYKKMPSSD